MVKSAFKNALTRVITRILYIIIFAFIVLFISSFFNIGLIDVYAQSGGGGGHSFDFTGKPLIGIDSSSNSSQVSVANGLTSNVFYDTNTRYDFYYYQFAIAPSDSNYCTDEYCYKLSYPTPSFYHDDIRVSHSILNSTGGPIPSNERFVYVSSFYTSFTNSLLLKKGNHYTYLVVFDVDDGVTLSPNDRNNFSISAINVSNNFNTLSSYNILNDVDNLSTNYYRFDSESYGNKRFAYLSVDFDLPLSFSENEVYLSDIWVEYNGYSDNPIDVPFNYLMYSRGDNSHSFKSDIYFFENGIFSFSDNKEANYDYLLPQDYDVIDSINVCPDEFSIESVICNIKRVFTMIEKFFIRISNFFRDLLNDSFDVSIDSNNDLTPVSNIVTMPLTMLNRFINGFNAQCYTFNLGSLLGTNLFINCVDVEHFIGSDLWFLIDILVSIFMCFNIMSLILMFFDKWTSFEDTFQLMYYPRHANTTEDYIPKHGGH